jgi:hypothetical protein
MIDVACVFKSGPGWLTDYVYRLRDMLQRNLHTAHRFVCVGDLELDVDHNIRLWPMISRHRVPPFWYKMQLFRPDIEWPNPVLYFDLDVIIKNDITDIVDLLRSHRFAMIASPFRADQSNSSILWWQGDYSWLWHLFRRSTPYHWQCRYNNPEDGGLYGDQGFIADHVCHVRIQDFLTANRITKITKGPSGTETSVLICAGKRKPWLMPGHPDVDRYWLAEGERDHA